jgi:myo-inositol-1(or 4)-monophosphatase
MRGVSIEKARPAWFLLARNPAVNLIVAQKIAVQAARAAGKVMRDHWRKPKRINLAEAHDIKLELDIRCQQLIEKILRREFPEIPLLGEEDDSITTSAASRAECVATAEYRWVVDPIDGTVNYFYGLPHAAVSIALQERDKSRVTGDRKNARSATNPATSHSPHVTVAGVIYDPFTDELWTTARGEPTRLNGKVVHVSNRSRLDEAMIAMGFSKNKETLAMSLPHLIRLSPRVRKIRVLGSAALELAYIACGRLDAYVERTLNLWDVAAGQLLVENAGGEFYSVSAPDGKLRLCADNGKLRRKLKIGSLLA